MNTTITINTNWNQKHNTFGGVISNIDFWGYNSPTTIASKIAKAENFDLQCKKNIDARENRGFYARRFLTYMEDKS